MKTKKGEYQLAKVHNYLLELKEKWPKSDTVLLIPDEDILYETIIKTMDIARTIEENPLFPNVVISGSLG